MKTSLAALMFLISTLSFAQSNEICFQIKAIAKAISDEAFERADLGEYYFSRIIESGPLSGMCDRIELTSTQYAEAAEAFTAAHTAYVSAVEACAGQETELTEISKGPENMMYNASVLTKANEGLMTNMKQLGCN